MADAVRNFAVSAVVTPPAPPLSGTTLTVQTAQGIRFPPVPFNATVWPAAAMPTPLNAEIVRVTAISGDQFTIARGQESTTPRTIVAGDVIAATLTRAGIENFAKLDYQNQFRAPSAQQFLAPGLGPHTSTSPGDLVVARTASDGAIYFGTDNQAYLFRTGTVMYLGGPTILQANAGVRDYGRTVAVGDWVDVPFNAGLFGGFNITAAAVVANAYALVGHSLHWKFMISSAATTAGNQPFFTIGLPVAMTSPSNQGGPLGGFYQSGLGHSVGQWRCAAGTNYVQLLYGNLATLPAGGAVEIWADITIRMP